MLKEQLLKEAENISATVELDSIFESVNLPDEVKAQFGTVFEMAVKKQAVALAESHIQTIAENADEKVEELVESRITESDQKFLETADKFLKVIAADWLAENKVQIENGIKVNLFESMFSGLKDLFVEHNVVVPDESVDVVAEMEDELTEANAKVVELIDKNNTLTESVNDLKREAELKEATAGLTLVQTEKVSSLIEGLTYSEQFTPKLQAIVEMVKGSAQTATLTEGINTPEQDEAAGLNFKVEAINENTDSQKPFNHRDAYAVAASKIK